MAPLNFSPRRGQPVRTLVCVIAFVVGTANADEPQRSRAGGVVAAKQADGSELPVALARLLPLHTKLGSPQPGDWLAEHKEPGQTYLQYVRSRPSARTETPGDLRSAAGRVRPHPAEDARPDGRVPGHLLPVAGEDLRRICPWT